MPGRVGVIISQPLLYCLLCVDVIGTQLYSLPLSLALMDSVRQVRLGFALQTEVSARGLEGMATFLALVALDVWSREVSARLGTGGKVLLLSFAACFLSALE